MQSSSGLLKKGYASGYSWLAVSVSWIRNVDMLSLFSLVQFKSSNATPSYFILFFYKTVEFIAINITKNWIKHTLSKFMILLRKDDLQYTAVKSRTNLKKCVIQLYINDNNVLLNVFLLKYILHIKLTDLIHTKLVSNATA